MYGGREGVFSWKREACEQSLPLPWCENAAAAQDAGRLPPPAHTWTNRAGCEPSLLLKTVPPRAAPENTVSTLFRGRGRKREERERLRHTAARELRLDGDSAGVCVFGEVILSLCVCPQVWSLSVSLSTSSSLFNLKEEAHSFCVCEPLIPSFSLLFSLISISPSVPFVPSCLLPNPHSILPLQLPFSVEQSSPPQGTLSFPPQARQGSS